jgi:hypothetical protein
VSAARTSASKSGRRLNFLKRTGAKEDGFIEGWTVKIAPGPGSPDATRWRGLGS